jgi:predicted nucleic acid-binding protein
MAKAFVDSDVILDFLLKREPFANPAGMIFAFAETTRLTLVTSTLSFMNVLYIAGGATNQATARNLARELRRLIDLASVAAEHVDAGLSSDLKDVEDYVQYAIAREIQADYLITRNVADYPREPSFVMTPSVFLNTLPRQPD